MVLIGDGSSHLYSPIFWGLIEKSTLSMLIECSFTNNFHGGFFLSYVNLNVIHSDQL